jgi:hypothetical protein
MVGHFSMPIDTVPPWTRGRRRVHSSTKDQYGAKRIPKARDQQARGGFHRVNVLPVVQQVQAAEVTVPGCPAVGEAQ